MTRFDPDILLVFLPALFRMGGMLLTGPIWSHVTVPLSIKTGIALFMTVAMWPTLSLATIPPVDSLLGLGALVSRELFFGILIGLVARLVLLGVEYAGQVIGFSIGLSIVNVMDPASGAQISIVSRFYGLCGLAIFFAVDAHHLLIRAVATSFRMIPIGTGIFGAGILEQLIDLAYGVFVTGIQIAAPIVAVLLLVELSMGLLVRTVPQMNIFIIGFPLKIGLGFVMIMITLPFLIRMLDVLFGRMDLELGRLLYGM